MEGSSKYFVTVDGSKWMRPCRFTKLHSDGRFSINSCKSSAFIKVDNAITIYNFAKGDGSVSNSAIDLGK